MGLSRAIPLFSALLALLNTTAASAAGVRSFSCFTDTLKGGLKRVTKDLTKPIQVPAQYRATDQELAQAFNGNAQYKSLNQLFSERSLSRLRNSPETLAVRNAIVKGGKFKLNTGRFFVYGTTIRTGDRLKVQIDNIKIQGLNGEYHGYNTETEGLKTGLAKILTGVYEGIHAIAAHHPDLTQLEIVGGEIVNTKLAQALSHMGFYSKKAGRRLTDEEIKAVAVNYWIKRRNKASDEIIIAKEFSNYVTLETNAKITHSSEHPSENSRSLHFQFPDLLPVGDPTEEATRKALAAAGYAKQDINAILRVLSRRLTEKEEQLYERSRHSP